MRAEVSPSFSAALDLVYLSGIPLLLLCVLTIQVLNVVAEWEQELIVIYVVIYKLHDMQKLYTLCGCSVHIFIH